MTHELRKLAEAATPGPWRWWGGYGGYLSSEAPNLGYAEAEVLGVQQGTVYSEYSSDPAILVIKEADAAYIVAANPKTVLELLDEIADLRISVVAFLGPHAAFWAEANGKPNYLHPQHYDLLEKCGARMDSFQRYEAKP